MSVMARYVRIFCPVPKDEDVARRNSAVVALQSWIASFEDPWSAVELASALADSVADGRARDAFALEVEKAIVQAGSAAFVREDHDLEIIIVALVSVLGVIAREPSDAHWGPIDALAATLWSALSFQRPVPEEAVEILRQEVMVASRNRTMQLAEKSRARSLVPEIGPLTISESVPTGAKASNAYRRATEPLVKALRENAELDREELEFLWWMMEDWSEVLNSRLSDADSIVRAVVAGWEGALKLRRLPSSGHRNVVLRGVAAGNRATLDAVLTALGDHRTGMAEMIDAERIARSASGFPLLAAIVSGCAEAEGAGIERDARDWGARVLLERSLLQTSTRRNI